MEESRIKLDNDLLSTLLRSNLSCYLGKSMNQDVLNDMTVQIIESIDYFVNKKDDSE